MINILTKHVQVGRWSPPWLQRLAAEGQADGRQAAGRFCRAGLRAPAGTAEPGAWPVPGRYHPDRSDQVGRNIIEKNIAPAGLNVQFLTMEE